MAIEQARLNFLNTENLDEFYAVGYGEGTLGGSGAGHTELEVTSLSGTATTPGTWAWALAQIAAGSGNVYVKILTSGTLNRSSVSSINKPNITIDALGQYVRFTGRGLDFGPAADNIVLLNINVDDISSGDGISLEDSNTPYYLAHVESSPQGGRVADGHIDIVNQSAAGQFGTIAWYRSNTHTGDELVMLHGDQNDADEDKNWLTIHHCFHNGTRLRHPLVTGNCHSVNNYIKWGTFAGIEVRDNGGTARTTNPEVWSENDTFDAAVAGTGGTPPSNERGVYYYGSNANGKVTGERLLNTAQANEQNALSVTDFHAAYTTDFTAHTASADHDLVTQRRAGATMQVTTGGTMDTVAADATSGKTVTLTLSSQYAWPAAGATFDALRDEIIAGFKVVGDAAFNPSTLFTAVTDVVRTSDTVVTCTASANLAGAAKSLYWEGDENTASKWVVAWNPVEIAAAGGGGSAPPSATVTITDPLDAATETQLNFGITWTLEAA